MIFQRITILLMSSLLDTIELSVCNRYSRFGHFEFIVSLVYILILTQMSIKIEMVK
jgi:hypothetical protein